MIIYPNVKKELFLEKDYRPLPPLRGMSVKDLAELIDNLEKAQENAFLYGNDLLSIALDTDIKKVELYYKMYSKKEEKAK